MTATLAPPAALPAAPPAERVMRARDLEARLGVHRITIHRWVKQGLFPAAVRLGPNTMGWRESQVAAWLATRPAAGARPR